MRIQYRVGIDRWNLAPIVAPLVMAAACLCMAFACADTAHARQEEKPAGAPATRAAPGSDQARQLPPPVLLGMRAELVRTKLRVRPTVVIVGSPDDYARMIAAWSLAERYPVLIDDGTDRAREDIARFVRAFEPQSVVRWAPEKPVTLPDAPQDRTNTLNSVWRAAWGAQTPEALEAIWKQTEFQSPGVVIAASNDPAWTAAIALAAGRGQNIIWVEHTPTSPSDLTTERNLLALDDAIRSGIDALKPAAGWRGLGDQIDAITLCLNIGARIPGPENDLLALTDRIGRMSNGDRYAWCGQIFGNESRAAYSAMCALFLQPSSGWVFDGYKPEFAPPYRLENTVEFLNQAEFRLSTNLPPRAGIDDWRDRSRFGMSADFIHVNSSGHARFFDLNPGRGFPSDVPPLTRPAIVHFIHSFSAQHIGDPDTVGGRWIENGAYAYLGSMNEPFLGAFLPAHAVVIRLFSKAPWGAAVRQDGGKLWKLNVFGDPLITFGPAAPRHDEPLTLEGAVSLEDEMRSSLQNRKIAQGIGALVMLGRDKDAVRIARAALDPQAATTKVDVARVALAAAFREREVELFLDLYRALTPADQRVSVHADMLWRTARPLIPSADESLITLLRETVRMNSIADDASALGSSIARLYGRDAAKSFFASLATRTTDAKAKQELIELGNKF